MEGHGGKQVAGTTVGGERCLVRRVAGEGSEPRISGLALCWAATICPGMCGGGEGMEHMAKIAG